MPALAACGLDPLPDDRPAAVTAIAREARLLARARAAAAVPARAAAALLAAAGRGILARAVGDPGRVAAGRLAPSEFALRGILLLRAATGRW